MGKPKEKWYGVVRKMIILMNNYGPESRMFNTLYKAVDAVNDELIKNDPKGKEIIMAVNMILIDQKHTYVSVARKYYYESTTVQHWVSKYIYMVGIKMGFPMNAEKPKTRYRQIAKAQKQRLDSENNKAIKETQIPGQMDIYDFIK